MAIASMVMGLASIFMVWCGFGYLNLILPSMAIIFGAISIKNDTERKGAATFGLVTGILALIAAIIAWGACVATINEMAGSAELAKAAEKCAEILNLPI